MMFHPLNASSQVKGKAIENSSENYWPSHRLHAESTHRAGFGAAGLRSVNSMEFGFSDPLGAANQAGLNSSEFRVFL
jgi:hypothetical protein